MAMICPQCNSPYEQRLQCPLCGTRLLFQNTRRLGNPTAGRPQRWQQQPWGRILVGLVLAQGLFYGLRHLLTAVLLAMWQREEVEQLLGSSSGVLLIQALRLTALLLGTVFAGAGQEKGPFLGVMIGAWNGVFSVMLLPESARSLTPIALFGQPLLQTVFGAVGGWLGCTLWKPLSAETAQPAALPRKRNALRSQINLFAGPVAWFRVGVGSVLAVAGTLLASLFFEKLLDLGHGALSTTDDMQDRLITMEIKALALLLGGVLAGATTSNGLKQGLCVGLASAVILIGIEMNFVERWLQMAGLTCIAALTLSLVGGWFGSQLFPPLVKGRRGGRLGRTMI
jgi:hypothetical protein